MKLSEAMKQATQGPVHVEDGLNLMDENGYSLTSLQCNYQDTHTRNRTNIALLAHWYNHGPKLLEELKEAARITRLSNRAMAAIAAAEEVEGL